MKRIQNPKDGSSVNYIVVAYLLPAWADERQGFWHTGQFVHRIGKNDLAAGSRDDERLIRLKLDAEQIPPLNLMTPPLDLINKHTVEAYILEGVERPDGEFPWLVAFAFVRSPDRDRKSLLNVVKLFEDGAISNEDYIRMREVLQ